MEDNDKILLSESEVYDVLQFANGLMYPTSVFTPWTQQANLSQLNNNQYIPSFDDIQKALVDTKGRNKQLIGYSQSLENTDMIFRRTMEYYSNILSFDLSIVCTNAFGSDYKTKEYKEDLDRVHRFLDKFDYKAEFKKVMSNVLRSEIYYTVFRQDSNRGYTLQMMPQDYCMTTGAWEKGILYDFDMTYFMRGTTDIELYPDSFKEHFLNLTKDQKYVPSAQLNDRDGSFALWQQLSPTNDGAWCFKLDSSNFANVPFLAPMMQDIISDAEMRMLQKDKNIASAYALLMGEFPMMDKTKSGQVKDAFSVSPQTMGKLLNLVQAGLKNNIKANAMPVENLNMYQYKDENPKMLDIQYNTGATTGSSASRLIYSSDKASQFELQAQITTDYLAMKKIYSQFENFLEFFINPKTRKFKFKFIFDGSNYDFERNERFDRMMQMTSVGLTPNKSYIASCVGIKPQDFDRMLDEAHSGNLTDNLTLLASIHTQGGAGEKGGRPIKKTGDLGDAGATAREYE